MLSSRPNESYSVLGPVLTTITGTLRTNEAAVGAGLTVPGADVTAGVEAAADVVGEDVIAVVEVTVSVVGKGVTTIVGLLVGVIGDFVGAEARVEGVWVAVAASPATVTIATGWILTAPF